MAADAAMRLQRLPPEVNRILFVRNLPYKITAPEIYDIFGRYGPIRQVRLGVAGNTRGTAFVVYEDIFDAKNAVDHLSGFNVCGRYLIVLYYKADTMRRRMDASKKKEENAALRKEHGVKTDAEEMEDEAGERAGAS